MVRSLTLAILGVCLVAAPARAQDAAADRDAAFLSWGSEVTLSSAYLWRGNIDVDHAILQPELWLGLGDVSVSSWSAIENAGLYEHDLSVAFERSIRSVDVSAGWINYFLPGEPGPHENEVFAGVAYSSRVTPSLTVWRGLGGSSSARYVEAGATTRTTWRRMSIEPKLALGFTRVLDEAAAMTHLESTVAVAWQRRGYALRPFITHVVGFGAAGRHHTAAGLGVVIR